MDIKFKCPSCQQKLEVNASEVGTYIQCPKCNAWIIVPEKQIQDSTKTGQKFNQTPINQPFQPNQSGNGGRFVIITAIVLLAVCGGLFLGRKVMNKSSAIASKTDQGTNQSQHTNQIVSFAVLDETIEQVEQKLGPHRFSRPEGEKSIRFYEDAKNGISSQITFIGGKSVSIQYGRNNGQPLTSDQIILFLEANAKGCMWVEAEKARMWTRNNQEVIAEWLPTKKHLFSVVYMKVVKEAIAETTNITPQALYETGMRHEKGEGVPKDNGKAFALFERAAEQGYVDAQVAMGMGLSSGRHGNPNKNKALYWFVKAATQGSADAQAMAGAMYFDGEGTVKNPTEAFKWSSKAAENGNSFGQYYLAACYHEGIGVRRDFAKAFSWFLKSANQGYASSQFWVALMYFNGEGIPRDREKALEWMNKAAANGNKEAQEKLTILTRPDKQAHETDYVATSESSSTSTSGKISNDTPSLRQQNEMGLKYYNGNGVSKDMYKAVEWWLKSAEQGYSEAQYNLGCCYDSGNGVPRNSAKAVEWWLKSAKQGNKDAQNNLGLCYANGNGVPRNSAKALEWWLKSAEQGYSEAQNNLGFCYANGNGVPKDMYKATEWWRKAAEQGNKDAQYNLGILRSAQQNESSAYDNSTDISPATKSPPTWQVTEATTRDGVRVFNENQYLAKHEDRSGGSFATAAEASEKARVLNYQQTLNMDAMKEAVSRGGNNMGMSSFRFGRWTYKYDKNADCFVVYQE